MRGAGVHSAKGARAGRWESPRERGSGRRKAESFVHVARAFSDAVGASVQKAVGVCHVASHGPTASKFWWVTWHTHPYDFFALVFSLPKSVTLFPLLALKRV